MPLFRTLFFKVFFWFWAAIFLAMVAAVTTSNWIDDDYVRKASQSERIHLLHLMERKRPIMAEGRKLWRKLRPDWNLVAVPVDAIGHLPHDVEEFVDLAAEARDVLWGQDDGWLMIGPIQRGDYLYVAITRKHWSSVWDDEQRWMIPIAFFGVITLLCMGLVWSLTRPIRRLQRTVRQLGKGNFDVSEIRSDANRYDEIGELSSDVVEMADALNRLLQSHQQLLRDVSHELRSPLTRLQIALGIARKKDPDGLLDAEHNRIERAVGQVDGLVSQILDLARLQQQDSQNLQLEYRSLANQLDNWVQDAEIEMDEKQIVLQSHLPDETIQCHWDWILVERAVDNILRNAIRFSPEGGKLDVSAQLTSDGQIEIAIQDEGPGVPEEDLQRIFNPFTQVDSARDHASGGYGIGLALVHRIVELHDGIIEACNQSPGLRITMRLPRKSFH